MDGRIELDVVIFGGGAAGLWLLDELRRAGSTAVLLEAFDLGSGQTIASQGIIHGGLKYTLSGLFTSAADAIREMPLLWRKCLAGEAEPDLSACRLRAEFCYLWRTGSLASKIAMIGARAGLRIKPEPIDREARPAALIDAPGTVSRLDEQVIEPASFLETLASRNRQRLLKIDAESGLEIESRAGIVSKIVLINPDTGEPIDLVPRDVVFLAGAGNERLREMAGLVTKTMQRRPLHMVMARGSADHLPELNGHCIDGSTPRLTITSAIDFAEHRIWQIGGRIAEDGIDMDSPQLVRRAKVEISEAVPGLDLTGIAWSTYKVDRAEAATGGARPDDVSVMREGNIITGWPTKLALVPRLAEETSKRRNVETSKLGETHREVAKLLDVVLRSTPRRGALTFRRLDVFNRWPRPAVALPPWETQTQWITDA